MNTGLFRALPDRHILTKDGPRRVKAESPTSDYGDESMDANDSLDAATEGYSIGPSKSRPVVSSSQQANGCAKPPYSFSCLIFMAIEDSEEKALPVKSIYAWVQHHFPYFRTAPAGWKNSVRHNLSLNKCFSKVDKSPALGKGSLWMVDPVHRPNLLQSLSKVPSHPHGGNDKVFMLSTRANGANRNRNNDPVNRIGVGNSASRPLSSSTSSGGPNTSGSRQLFTSASSSQPCEPSYHASSMGSSLSKEVPHRNVSSSPVSSTETPSPRDVPSTSSASLMSATNSPDPTLFPFLARRLGGLGTHVSSSETLPRSGIDNSVPVDVSIEKLTGVASLAGVGIEDVDAANAMLTLKHGHKAMAPLQEALLSLREGVARQQHEESYLRRKRKLADSSLGETSSSIQDHSYGPPFSTHSMAGMAIPSTEVTLYSLPSHSTSSSCSLASHSSTSPCSSTFSSPCSSTPPTPPFVPSSARGKVRSRIGPSVKGGEAGSPTSSVDEAFSDGSFESDVGDVGQQSPSDFQQMVDGADALLNFAARATTLMPQLLMGRVPDDNQHQTPVRALPAPRPRPNIPSSFSSTPPPVDCSNPIKASSHSPQSANYEESRGGSERLFSPIQDHGANVKNNENFGEEEDDLFCSETLEPLPKKAMIESSGERLSSPHEDEGTCGRVVFVNDSRMTVGVDCAAASPDGIEHRLNYSRDQSLQKQSFMTRSPHLKNYAVKTGSASKLGKVRFGDDTNAKPVKPSTSLKKVSKPRRSATSKLSSRPMVTARR